VYYCDCELKNVYCPVCNVCTVFYLFTLEFIVIVHTILYAEFGPHRVFFFIYVDTKANRNLKCAQFIPIFICQFDFSIYMETHNDVLHIRLFLLDCNRMEQYWNGN
jgi:hypothetical protein